MANWKERTALYEVHEVGKSIDQIYEKVCTGAEMSAWCNMRNEMYGYIEGLGGDRTYSCWAVEILN